MQLALRAAEWVLEGRLEEALRLAVVASLAPPHRLSGLAGLEDEELRTILPVRVAELSPRPRWLPPPEGWGMMREVLERVSWERAAEASRIAHFFPLSLARVARAAWDAWGDSEKTGEVWQRLVRGAAEAARRAGVFEFVPELYAETR